MGWAQIHISSRDGKLNINFGGGEEAAEERWANERERMEQLERESYEERPSESIIRKIPSKKVSPFTISEGEIPEESIEKQPTYEELLAQIRAYEMGRQNEYYDNRNNNQSVVKKRKRVVNTEEDNMLPDRYYLGRKLRPAQLEVQL